MRSRSTGNSSSTALDGGLAVRRRRRGSSHAASRRFSATVSVGNTPWPPGHLHDAAIGDLVRRRVGDVRAVEEDRAVDRRRPRPEMALEQRRLAGAVGAEQGDDLALVDLEVDVEQHLHAVVVRRRGCGRPAAWPRRGCAGGRTSACAAVEVHTFVDVALHIGRGRGQHHGADQEHRDHHEQPRADAVAVGDPADHVQGDQAREDEQRRHREAQRSHLGRDGQRERGEDPRVRGGPPGPTRGCWPPPRPRAPERARTPPRRRRCPPRPARACAGRAPGPCA